jgi:hypothetical protein
VAQAIMDEFGGKQMSVVLITPDPDVFKELHRADDGVRHHLPGADTENHDVGDLHLPVEMDPVIAKEEEHDAEGNLMPNILSLHRDSYRLGKGVEFLNTHVFYGDFYDPMYWHNEKFSFKTAAVIVSCLPSNRRLGVELAKFCKENDKIPWVQTCDNFHDPEFLYEHGVTYCLQTEQIASQQFSKLLRQEIRRGRLAFRSERSKHKKELRHLKKRLGSMFEFF